MADLSDRIKQAAQEIGGLNRLAERTGIPRRTLGSWLEGRKPKPEALQKIASAAELNLAWLISGIGEKYVGERLEREAEVERQNAEFEASFSRGMRALERGLRQDDPSYDMQVRARAPKFDVALLERVARIVTETHKEAGIKIAPEKVSAEAGKLYNELMARVTNPADAEEVEATLPQLRHLLKKRLAEAAAEPGSGKRSAS